MGESPRNSVDSMDTHSKYTHSVSTRADNYSDSFESDPEHGQIHELKQAPPRKVKKTTMQWRKKQSTQRNSKMMRTAPTYEMEQKIVTAKKLNNNELRNLNAELLRQIELQKEEIRLLKRMEYRQGKALEKFENSNNRLPMLLESHNKEMLSLREQVRTMKSRYRKSQESLREVEDELEKTRNRLNKYKVLVDDESLQERAELTRQLNLDQQKVLEMETKIRDLETYVQHLVKNHKHEISIEKTQSKKIKLNIQELEEKYNRLEIQLLEKEKELEVWNIYSNRQRNTNHKLSSSHFHTPRSTPSVKSKSHERIPPLTPPPWRMKKYEERRRQSKKQKEAMLKKFDPSSTKAASDIKINQLSALDDINFNPPMQALSQPQKAIEPPPTTTLPAMDTSKFTCHQESIQEEEDDLGEMLENIKLDKMEPKEVERTAVKEAEEELKKIDMEMIDEDIKEDTMEKLQKNEEEERKKKDILLARLKELDTKYQTLMDPRNDPFTGSPNKAEYNFSKQTNNLHEGKPSNDLNFLDSPLKLSPGKPNSILKANQNNVGSPSKKLSRLSSRKSDSMIEDFFPSPGSPQNPDGLNMSGFVNGDVLNQHGSSENKIKKSNVMESSVYKELFGENGDESRTSTKNRNNDTILGDLNRRPGRQDWINQTVGGLFSGDSLNNSYEGNKLLPSRQQISLFETRSTLNAFDNSSDSIEEIIL